MMLVVLQIAHAMIRKTRLPHWEMGLRLIRKSSFLTNCMARSGCLRNFREGHKIIVLNDPKTGGTMNQTSPWREGESYTRKDISKVLGGGTQNYLPHKNQHVVCGCFRTDLNPRAPWEILPANTDDKKRWAEVFASQQEAIPIFLKRGSNRWEYRGLWRCVAVIKDADIVSEKSRQARRTSAAMLLKLEKSLT